MAIEKDNYGFRLTSWNAKIANLGQTILETKSNSEIADLVGCTEGSASNYRKAVAEATGWVLPSNNRAESGDIEKKPRQSSKRKGLFPAKLDASLNKALGCQDDDSPDWIADPVWADFVRAREIMGNDWVGFISKKVKEKELSEFNLWVESNDAADTAESALTAAQQKSIDSAIALLRANGYTVIMPA